LIQVVPRYLTIKYKLRRATDPICSYVRSERTELVLNVTDDGEEVRVLLGHPFAVVILSIIGIFAFTF
jgi:hypothetical protein